MFGAAIRQELTLFALAAGQGWMMCLLYDFLRSCRSAISSGRKMQSFTDFWYWVTCGLLLAYVLLLMNQSLFRGYQFLGMLSGASAWYLLFSHFFVRISSRILRYPVFFIKFLGKWLIFFLRRCRILGYRVFKWIGKGKRVHLRDKRNKGIGNNE